MAAPILAVIEEAHNAPFSVQSDYARSKAQWVAAAASMGFITTECPAGYGRRWRTTIDGLLFLKEQAW